MEEQVAALLLGCVALLPEALLFLVFPKVGGAGQVHDRRERHLPRISHVLLVVNKA
jgi:hypothetical protein